MIHETEEFSKVFQEMVRSGVVSAPDESEPSAEEHILDQDSTTTSQSRRTIMLLVTDRIATAFILETIRLFPPVPLK
jgi:hypothetical protein